MNLPLKTTLILALLVGCTAPPQSDVSSGLSAFEEFSALSHAEARAHYHSLDEAGQLALWEESWVLALQSAEGAERIALEYALENIDSDPDAVQDELMTLVSLDTFTAHFASLGPLVAGPSSFVAASEIPVVDGVGGSTSALADGAACDIVGCPTELVCVPGPYGASWVYWCSGTCTDSTWGCGFLGLYYCGGRHVATFNIGRDSCDDF